ncbi:MAG: bile acid:sodium symporter family protein [Parasphingorhabdus sp.]
MSWGLIAVMFSLGLSLAVRDFTYALQKWQSVGAGLLGQLILLPILGAAVVLVFGLPPALAIGLLILAFSPGGITSNAVVFAVKGNVALSVVLTSIASLVTVLSTPYLIGLSLDYFMTDATAPQFSVVDTIKRLFQMTVLPVTIGMVIHYFIPDFALRLVHWLRPAALIVLICVIGFSIYVSADLVWQNIAKAGPAVFALNILAMALGLGLARMFRLGERYSVTIGIEVGVQNATVATFLTMAVMNDIILAVIPTLYGVIMLANAFLFAQLWRSKKLPWLFGQSSSATGRV